MINYIRDDNDEEEDILENRYESRRMAEEMSLKTTKVMLPIKTKKGMEYPTVTEDRPSAVYPADSTPLQAVNGDTETETPKLGFVSAALIIAQRRKKLAEYKARIGILSASFLEDPENRVS